jgi:hypothetical protein
MIHELLTINRINNLPCNYCFNNNQLITFNFEQDQISPVTRGYFTQIIQGK